MEMQKFVFEEYVNKLPEAVRIIPQALQALSKDFQQAYFIEESQTQSLKEELLKDIKKKSEDRKEELAPERMEKLLQEALLKDKRLQEARRSGVTIYSAGISEIMAAIVMPGYRPMNNILSKITDSEKNELQSAADTLRMLQEERIKTPDVQPEEERMKLQNDATYRLARATLGCLHKIDTEIKQETHLYDLQNDAGVERASTSLKNVTATIENIADTIKTERLDALTQTLSTQPKKGIAI